MKLEKLIETAYLIAASDVTTAVIVVACAGGVFFLLH